MLCICLVCGPQILPKWDDMRVTSLAGPTSDATTTAKEIQPGSCHLCCLLLWGERRWDEQGPAQPWICFSGAACGQPALGHAATGSPHICAWRTHSGGGLLRSKLFLRDWHHRHSLKFFLPTSASGKSGQCLYEGGEAGGNFVFFWFCLWQKILTLIH